MKIYKKLYELTGKSTLKFKGEDTVGKFWVVTEAKSGSILDDILFEADVFDLVLQIKGGLVVPDIIGIYKNKNVAKHKAEAQMESAKE